MKTVHEISSIRDGIHHARMSGKSIGFVPTMGNLHEGHLSLIRSAKRDGHFVVASIFVNPMQFNDANDLARYPRTLEQDQVLLAQEGCDVLFAPNAMEMYPDGQQDHCVVHVPVVSEGLCGGSRPGHFDGVSTVVTKLFNIVQADAAYFGEKDFQQVAVINKMINDLCIPTVLHRVPTARADDGLALSSRNGYLSEAERARAPELFAALQQLADNIRKGNNLADSINMAIEQLNDGPWRCDYVEIRNSQTLQVMQQNDTNQPGEWVILAAAFLGAARLIDNLVITLNR